MSTVHIEKFTYHLEQSGKSKSTIVAYRKDLEQLNEHLEGDLQEVVTEVLKEAIDALQQKHEFSPKTISRKINSYRTFYRFMIENGEVTHNPAEEISHPKFTPKKPRVLSQIEYLALREISRGNDRLLAMIELMLQTGIRIGELSRLKVRHINIEQSKPHIAIEEFSTTEPRKVPLNMKATELLKKYLDSENIQEEEAPLFSTRDGNHIIIRNIRSSIDRAMAKAGIEEACVNDLRNTFIVAQLNAGVPVDHIAEVVGHKSKTTTQKYIELLNDKYRPNGEMRIVEL